MRKLLAALLILTLFAPLAAQDEIATADNEVIFKVKKEMNNKYGKFYVLEPRVEVNFVSKVLKMEESANAPQWLTCNIKRVEIDGAKDEYGNPIRLIQAHCNHGLKLELQLLIFPPGKNPDVR